LAFVLIEHFDATEAGVQIDADVCIVGSGAAGITLARRLASTGVDVCILESGGADYEQPIQDLGAGESIGFPYYQLEQSRLRLFGGTTAVWGGRVAQLDRIDFEQRPWVDHSGWPFSKETLAGYYAEAQISLGLDPSNGDETLWDQLGLRRPKFDSERLSTSFFRFDEQFERFTLRRCQDFVESTKIRVLLHATVLDIRARADGAAVESIEIGNLRGGRGVVRAQIFVLAAGGLENPRILLQSRGVHANGLGNNEDQVGRYFMEHPHARAGRVVPDKLWRLLNLLPRSHRHEGQRVAAVALPSEQLQEREGILNSALTLSVRRHPNANLPAAKWLYETLKWKVPHDHRGRLAWWIHRRARQAVTERVGVVRRWLRAASHRRGLYVVARAEQAPNPDSRVVLSDERDVLGIPQIALDWRFGEIDKRSVRVVTEMLGREIQRLSMGRIEISPWLEDDSIPWEVDPLISNHPIGGYHHMGTTRMSTSPRRGVVDQDCRVHGLGNLYIAGSSVFPTSGWANPTLTILALTLRLGDHLTKSILAHRIDGA
jgi:choline dehydrogenase-like flavoprotein